MGRECTNALSQTPLWLFALDAYSGHKNELLYWQDSYRANVNDLLLLAFAEKNNQTIQAQWWQQRPVLILRNLIQRVRALRRGSAGTPTYEHCKQLELELEGIDIQLLQYCLVNDGQSAEASMQSYEKNLNIKKGALAPFINTLVN